MSVQIGMTDPHRINDAVYFLSKFAPQVLDSCRATHQELGDELDLGVELQQGKRRVEPTELVYARAEVMCRGLAAAIAQASVGVEKSKERLARSRRMKTAARALVLTSQSAALGSLGLSKPLIAGVAATLALLASVGTMWADSSNALWGSANRLEKAYAQVVDSKHEAETILDNLNALKTIAPHSEQLDSVLDKLTRNGNAVCRKLVNVLGEIGVVTA